MNRLLLFLSLFASTSALAADAEWRDNGNAGCAGEIKFTRFTVTVVWNNLPGARIGVPMSIRNATNPTNSLFVFTPGTANGSTTITSTFDVHGLNTDAYGQTQHMDYVGTHTGEDAALTVTGGRDITRFNSQNTSGCPITGTMATATLAYTIGTSNTATWVGSVKANCSTQHALGLTVNGVQLSYQVTSAFATRAAPSTITANYSCTTQSNPDCVEGAPWIFSVDGVPSNSGTIHFESNHLFNTTLNVNGYGSFANPVFFDCGPKAGALGLSGTLSNPGGKAGHVFSVRVDGGGGTTVVTTAGQTSVSLATTVQDVQNGARIEWMIDGIVVATHFAAINCSYNAETSTTTCGGTDSYSGKVSDANPTPPPASPTPTVPPSPTVPPQSYTPPPMPTYTPPTPHTTPTGGGDVTVMNPQDIYKPIVDALSTTNSGTASRNNGFSHSTLDMANRGHIDDIQPLVDDAAAKTDQMVTKGGTLISPLKDGFSALPTTLGSVTTLPFGLANFNGIGPGGGFTQFPTTINLTPYLDWIALGRRVQLWGLTLFFAFLTVRALTWTQ